LEFAWNSAENLVEIWGGLAGRLRIYWSKANFILRCGVYGNWLNLIEVAASVTEQIFASTKSRESRSNIPMWAILSIKGQLQGPT